jgi:ATP-dependent Zn protease
MPARYVVDMDQIETSIHKSGHAAAGTLYNDASGWRRLYVAGADWRRGINDDGRESVLFHHLLDVLMGGRAAEALIFDGEVSTGASDDLQRATEIAMEMVTCVYRKPKPGRSRDEVRQGLGVN